MNVKHPGPSVGGNTDLQPKLIDLLLAALSPGRAGAGRGRDRRLELQPALRRRASRDRAATTRTTTSTAWAPAARRCKDGNDAEITRHSNCRNTPVEVFEHRYPLLTLELLARARFRRRRASIAAASRPSGRSRVDGRRDHLQRALRSLARSRRRASSAGSPAAAPSCSSAGPARASSDASTRSSASPRRRSSRTSSSGAATSSATGRPAAAASASPRERDVDLVRRTSPRGTSAPRPPSATTESRPRRLEVGHEHGQVGRAEVRWHDTNVVGCPVCGRLILRRAWVFDGRHGRDPGVQRRRARSSTRATGNRPTG